LEICNIQEETIMKMDGNHITIRRESPADYAAAENLTREAFWNVYRPGCLEHYVLHVLRDDPAFVPELDLVMEKDGRLVGHVMYMRAAIRTHEGRELPVMTFGPISIHPDFQRQGLGKLLLDFSMDRARELGAGALCIEGNIGFYGKSGFVVAGTKGIRYHGEPEQETVPYFLLKELKEGFLEGVTGVYHTPRGYYVDEGKAEEFDKSFPPKTKLKLPGQLV
jgi:putative acetyltransferase